MAKKAYIAEFDAKADAYYNRLNEMERRTIASSKKLSDSFGAVKNSIVGLVSIGAITTFAQSSINAFVESQKSLEKLDRAIGGVSISLRNWIDTMELTTRYGDEEIKYAMARLGYYIKEEELLKRITEATMDFAAAKEMDLTTAAELVAKAVAGGTDALSRYGIKLGDIKDPVQRVNELLKQFALFQDEGKLKTDSVVDSLELQRKKLENVQESIGEKILPVWVRLLETINAVLVGVETYIKFLSSGKLVKPETALMYGLAPLFGDKNKSAGGDGNKNNQPVEIIMSHNNRRRIKNNKPNRISDYTPYDVTRMAKYYDIEKEHIPRMPLRVFNPEVFAEQMQEAMERTFDSNEVMNEWMREAAEEFNYRFNEAVDVANRIRNVLNIAAHTFVSKLIEGINTVAEILGIIKSIVLISTGMGDVVSILSGGGGGAVIGAAAGLPISAGGNSSYRLPSNYNMMLQTESIMKNNIGGKSETVKAIKQTHSKPMIINLQLDGQTLTKAVISRENTMVKGGRNINEL